MSEKKEFLKPLTDWEIGQELVRAQDQLFESKFDMAKDHPAHLLLTKLAVEIGDYFEENHNGKSHGFGLFNTKGYSHKLKD